MLAVLLNMENARIGKSQLKERDARICQCSLSVLL